MPSHLQVQRYLEAYAAEFGLLQHVRLGTRVQRITPLPADDDSSSGPTGWLRWQVIVQQVGSQGQPAAQGRSQDWDAVVVANGHYSRPKLPQLPGQDVFPGRQLHSHNYRRPEAYR
jgi:cation diffusion facilitator CzcD-associated flavoprotein CzcO